MALVEKSEDYHRKDSNTFQISLMVDESSDEAKTGDVSRMSGSPGWDISAEVKGLPEAEAFQKAREFADNVDL